MRFLKNHEALIIFSTLFLGVSCVQKQKLLDSPLVSMSRSYIPNGAILKEKGSVRGQFCESLTGDKGSIGLFDEAIKKAQRTYQVDFISHASFWVEGSCVSVEGTGQVLVADRSYVTPMPMASPPAPPIMTTPPAPQTSVAPVQGRPLPRYNPHGGKPQNPIKTNR